MGKGLDRRTFVRGAAGAVGMGAVGALSPKLSGAAAPKSGSKAGQALDAKITVKLVDKGGGKHGGGRPQRWKIDCPDAEAGANSKVTWEAGAGVSQILVVSFKGRSPFRHSGKELQVFRPGDAGTTGGGKPGDPLTAQTAGGADGTYTYTIVVQADSNSGGAIHSKDPDLDII
ncbi:MAG: hypothetical protein JSV95_01530 [Gemmatimonadota bacterium]|nr:MAG: hypothetical protein JSV95_01530 [Gemmatimonadota bacterium]